MINVVVSKALFDTQIQTLDSLLAFLPEKYGDDVDMDFMNEVIASFKTKLEKEYKVPHGSAKALKEIEKEQKKNEKASNKKEKKATTKAKKSVDNEETTTNNDTNTNTTDIEVKKKRAPSAYTMFIKHKMALLKKEQPSDTKGTALMKLASEAWKALSDDDVNKLKTNFTDIAKKETYEEENDADKQSRIAKEMYESVFGSTSKNIVPKKKDANYEGIVSDDSDE